MSENPYSAVVRQVVQELSSLPSDELTQIAVHRMTEQQRYEALTALLRREVRQIWNQTRQAVVGTTASSLERVWVGGEKALGEATQEDLKWLAEHRQATADGLARRAKEFESLAEVGTAEERLRAVKSALAPLKRRTPVLKAAAEHLRTTVTLLRNQGTSLEKEAALADCLHQERRLQELREEFEWLNEMVADLEEGLVVLPPLRHAKEALCG